MTHDVLSLAGDLALIALIIGMVVMIAVSLWPPWRRNG